VSRHRLGLRLQSDWASSPGSISAT
jgi:hypothetical protein